MFTDYGETEHKDKGFAGRRARTFPEPGPAAADFRGGGSRPKTEFKGFAGRRTRTFPEPWPAAADFRGGGSRPETEFKGFAGRSTPTSACPSLRRECLPYAKGQSPRKK